MCLIAWNWQPGNPTELLLLSNRDEFYARAAQPLHWWDADGGTEPQILAGRDLQGGGTWLGLSRGGRLAALTNYRSGTPQRADAPSRGELVADFLNGNASAHDYLADLRARAHQYNPFNLLLFDGRTLLGLESRGARIVHLEPGLGALSNADFHTPWPKLVRLRTRLQERVEARQTSAEALLPLLHDRSLAADADLPQTGVPVELERALSATFITTPPYGTRACSVVALGAGRVDFTEQSFGPIGQMLGQRHEAFVPFVRNR
jgi:uncharacterized protein with NRDE domain